MTGALAGKRALVTGAGRRLGRVIAEALGAEGMSVAVHHRASRSGAEAACARIRELGGRAIALEADLTDRAASRALVDAAVGALGGLDLLVASAAGFERTPLSSLNDSAWDRALSLNLTSAYVLSLRAASALAIDGGSIVFITCASATTPFRNYLPYVVSKGALRQLMRALALELAPKVRVNAVAPGTVLLPEGSSADVERRLARSVPLQRTGTPEDVARAVVFLASSPFITGHEILVDGGRDVAKTEHFE